MIRRAMITAMVWSAAVGASVGFALLGEGWAIADGLPGAVGRYVPGAFAAAFGASLLCDALPSRLGRTRRSVLFFTALWALTLLVCGGLIALEQKLHFGRAHAAFPSMLWVVQTISTMLGAFALFLWASARLVIPYALPVSLVLAVFHARGPRGTQRCEPSVPVLADGERSPEAAP